MPSEVSGGIVAAHAALSPRDVLIDERRALYAFAAELAGTPLAGPTDDLLDSPVVRAAIGTVLADGVRGEMSAPITELVHPWSYISTGEVRVPVASTAATRRHLRPALRLIAGQARQLDPSVADIDLLIDDDREFRPVLDLLRAGAGLAARMDIELVDDLLPHIGLVAVLRPGTAGRLGSASLREYPGLLVLPCPTSAADVAEALVHEGAHQKIFDLMITHDVLGAAARDCPPYHPPWQPPGVQWPLEQVFAAWHAYSCLARFHERGRDMLEVGPGSLLPVAAERSALLSRQVLGSARYLGRAAHKLVEAVGGRRPPGPPAEARNRQWPDELTCVCPKGSARVLAGQAGLPPQLYWLEPDDPQE